MPEDQNASPVTSAAEKPKQAKIQFDPNLTALERQQLWFNSQLQKKQAPERKAFAEAQRRLQREKTVERWQKQEAVAGSVPKSTQLLNGKASKVIYLSDLIVVDDNTGTITTVKDQRGRDQSSKGKGIETKGHANENFKHVTKLNLNKKPSAVKKAIFSAREKWLNEMERAVEAEMSSIQRAEAPCERVAKPLPSTPPQPSPPTLSKVSKVPPSNNKKTVDLFSSAIDLFATSDEDSSSSSSECEGSVDFINKEVDHGGCVINPSSSALVDETHQSNAVVASHSTLQCTSLSPKLPKKTHSVRHLRETIQRLEDLFKQIGDAKARAEKVREQLESERARIEALHDAESKRQAALSKPIRKSKVLVISSSAQSCPSPSACHRDPILTTETDKPQLPIDLPPIPTVPVRTIEEKELFDLVATLRKTTRYLRERLMPSVACQSNTVSTATPQRMLTDAITSNSSKARSTAADDDGGDAQTHDASDLEATNVLITLKKKCNFFPPLNRYGVGAHQLRVDYRTAKRHPALLSKDTIDALLADADAKVNEERMCAEARADTGKVKQDQGSSSPAEMWASLGFPAVLSSSVSPFTRDYVSNILTDRLDDLSHTLIETLREAQQKLKEKNPLHFKARKRYVCGLREVLVAISTGSCKCVLMSPDVERIGSENGAGVDAISELWKHCNRDQLALETVESDPKWEEAMMANLKRSVKSLGLEGSVGTIIAACYIKSIPIIYCLSRHRMAHSIRQRDVKVSCIALLSVNGANDVYKALMLETLRCRKGYDALKGMGTVPTSIAN